MSPIVERFKGCEGEAGMLAFEGKPALELLASNLLVGVCLAMNHRFHAPVNTFPLTTARNLMHKPQRPSRAGRRCVLPILNSMVARSLPTAQPADKPACELPGLLRAETEEMIHGAQIEPLAEEQRTAAHGFHSGAHQLPNLAVSGQDHGAAAFGEHMEPFTNHR